MPHILYGCINVIAKLNRKRKFQSVVIVIDKLWGLYSILHSGVSRFEPASDIRRVKKRDIEYKNIRSTHNYVLSTENRTTTHNIYIPKGGSDNCAAYN